MKVFITREIPQSGIKLLESHPQIQLNYKKGRPLNPAGLKKGIRDADAIIPVIPDAVTKEIINSAGPRLKVIATYSVGFDHIDMEAATKRKIYVANTPGDLTESVAEHTFALMLAVGKRLAEADRFCRAGKYKYWEPMAFIGPKFKGKTLGIIGFGRIGQQLAKMAKYGLDMDILYTDPRNHLETEELLNAKRVELNDLLDRSDVVSINCNLCEETKHLIGEDEFKRMKPFAYLINTARGPIVHEEALAQALKDGIIAGAGLDVFENEPKINKILMKLENVILTPHIASATREARLQMATMAAQNVIDVLIDNKPPRHLVNTELTQGKVSTLAS